jgi:hypothetical protein
MRAIRFRITPELLRQSLQLPEKTTVRGLYEDFSSPELIWWIVLESEDFPEVAEGARPTEAMATVTEAVLEGERFYEFDWGLDG